MILIPLNSKRKKAWLCAVLLIWIFIPGLLQAKKVIPVPFRVDNLSCEYKINPISIDVTNPRLSWKLITLQRDLHQTGYQCCIANKRKKPGLDIRQGVVRSVCTYLLWRPAIAIATKSLLAGKGLE